MKTLPSLPGALSAVEAPFPPVTVDLVVDEYFDLAFTYSDPATIAFHRYRLNHLIYRLPPRASILEIDADLLLRIIAAIRKSNYTPTYIHSIIRAFKRFTRWCASTGILPVDPAASIKLPRLPRTGRKGISDHAVQALQAAARNPRDLAILKILETTGCRLAGVQNIRLADLDLPRRRIIVTEKFEKQRTVFFDQSTQAAIQSWLKIHPDPRPGAHLFVTTAARPLSKPAIEAVIRRLARRAGVDEPCSPHQWRHRFARKLAENGLPLGQISQILGHADVSITVKHYGIFSVNELQANYDKYMSQMSSYDI